MAQRPSVLQLEQAFLDAWPALETKHDGGWLWRYADNYTKRANSAQSMDPSDEENADERLQQFTQWAEAQHLKPTFRVSPLAGTKVISALNTHKWEPFEQSIVMAMPVGAAFTPTHEAKSFSATDPEWFEVQAAMSGYGKKTIAALKTLLERITSPAVGFLINDDEGNPAAAALTSDNAGIGVYLNVVVREDLRGQGFGRSIMQAALNWSRAAGAKWAAIQVVAGNEPAVNLYRSLGFEEVYRYHYRRPV